MKSTDIDLWIVDDEPAMCLGITRALENFSAVYDDLGETARYKISSMESGEALLERLDQHAPPRLLLLDSKLPGMTGIEVMQIMAGRKAPIMTVMITAYATLENAIKATKLGAFDFLAKPFTPVELRHAVSRASREIILTRRAKELEQEKRQVRFDFISVLAHELKSPLAAIEGYVDMLRNNTAGVEVLDRMEARALGMRKLIADLLDLTAIESGRRHRDLQSTDTVEIARQVLDAHATMAQAKQVKLGVHASGPCMIKADHGELEMLLRNLVSNAIKYNTRGGSVTIDFSMDQAGIKISVTDTGIGISKTDQARLFTEFSRIRNSRTHGIEGSGLGLSIVSRIAALYEGTVSVVSEENHGSTFTVFLPLK